MYRSLRSLIVLVALSFLAACGGGDEGGSSGGSSLPSSYTGTTAPAAVTASNARALSVDAYLGSQIASSLNVLAKAVSGGEVERSLILDTAALVESSVVKALQQPKSAAKTAAAITVQDTVIGYTGWYSYSVSKEPATGFTSGTLQYANYRSTSTSSAVTGTVTFSGVFDDATATFTSYQMSFANVGVSQGATNISMSGSFTGSVAGSTRNQTMRLSIKDNNTNRVYLLWDYSSVLTGTSLVVSGTYYHPVHGYVVLTTQTPLTINEFSGTPISGVLLFTGRNGSKARLTFYSGGYTVAVDTTGNGTFVTVP